MTDHVPGPVTRVVVVGAGFAGIAAANALKRAGVDVLVLEGRASIGGRTKTVIMNGTPVDSGGSWIHQPTGNPLSELADLYKLDRRGFALEDIFANVRLVDVHAGALEVADRDEIMNRADDIERELIASAHVQLGCRTMADMIENALTGIADRRLRDWVSFVLYTGFQSDLASAADDISVANYAVNAGYSGGDDCVVGGYTEMITRLAAGVEICSNTAVIGLQQSAQEVIVTCANGREERCSHVVVTVPLGVLKAETIKFSPSLPPAKLKSIESLGYGAFEKLILQFEDAFWRTEGSRPHAILLKGHPIFPYWIDLSSILGVPTLAAHISGPPALLLADLSHDAALDQALEAISTAFGQSVPVPKAVFRTNWLGDPCSLGAYTHLSPASSPRDIEILSEPVGRVLFAGEATSTQRFGYVDGAYSSGLREAWRLLLTSAASNGES